MKTKDQIIDWFVQKIANLSSCKREEVDISLPFNHLGLSSLDLVQLLGEFNSFVGEEFSPTLFFEYPDIESFATYVADPQRDKVAIDFSIDTSVETGPVSVIGMSCRFPKANSLEEFWKLLVSGKSAISQEGTKRWKRQGDFPPYAGYLDDPFSFDAAHFGISPAEEKEMDPQQKLLMELSWHAIEDAGYAPEELRGKKVGVFIGISTSDFSLEKILSSQKAGIFTGTGIAHSIAANRISYFYDFKGPSFAVDTACSSSLVALDQGYQSLNRHACDIVLVGGVNLLLSPYLFESFYKAGMLSPDGLCKTFSDDANGYVRGEGGGFIVLKRKSDAIKDKNRIYCNLLSTAINQDGNTNNITAPNGNAQQLVIREAISRAGLKTEDIDFIETHGTGTALGDPIEYESIRKVFSKDENTVKLGALKTVIGHLEASAGIAGAIKTCLSLYHGHFPANLNFNKLNSKITKVSPNIELLLKPETLNPKEVYRTGVSSFGFGGTNSHAIFESYNNQKLMIPLKRSRDQKKFGFYLSGSSKEALIKMGESLANMKEELSLSDLSSHLFYHKDKLKYRIFFQAKSWAEFKKKCASIALGNFSDVYYGENTVKTNLKTAFLFTGQGSQYPNMSRELYYTSTFYRKVFNQCLNTFQQYFEQDLQKIVFPKDECMDIYETAYAQPLLFCCGYSLYKLYEHLGLTPSVSLGHSLGEIIAVTCAEMMSLEDACLLVYHRSRLMQKTTEGAMLVVYQSYEDCKKLADNETVDLAAVNGPRLCVLSGTVEKIERIKNICEEQNVKTKLLNVRQAFHSRLMEPIVEEFKQAIDSIVYREALFDVISAHSLEVLKPEDLSAEFWAKHLREPTYFYKAMTKLESKGCQFLLEVGVNPALLPMYKMFQKESATLLTTLDRKKEDDLALESSLGRLFVSNSNLKIHPFTSKKPRQSLNLPLTPFIHKKVVSVTEDKKMKKSKEDLKSELKDIMVRELGIERALIEDEGSLMNLGADSLTLLNILEMINDVYGVNIPVSSIFSELDSLNKIVEYIDSNTIVEQKPVEIKGPSSSAFEDLDLSFQTNGNMNVNEVIQKQLEIIQMQLKVLGGQPAGSVPNVLDSVPVPKSDNKKDDSMSGKGVLGNFNTKAMTITEDIEEGKREYLENLIRRFTSKTAKSKEHNQKYRTSLADNRVSAGFRPQLKEAVYPIIFKKAKGARFTDLDGNDFVDFTMGFGVNLFGHSPDFIQEKITEQLETGMAVGPQSDLAGPVAEKFCKLTGMERVAFVNSGTEAVMTAVRLARAKTRRNRVVLFEGSYHGHSDVVLGRKNRRNQTLPVAAGIPTGLINDLIVLDYDSDEALTYLQSHGNEIAAVIVEGVQSRFPEIQPKEFLLKVRELTKNSGTAMIVDEVINGFRSKVGGVQEDFGFKADIAAYGKIIGGGLPIGALAGKKEYLDFIDGGFYQFGDQSFPQNEITFFAGTFCKHPLAMSACYEVLKKMEEKGTELLADLNQKTNAMAAELNEYFDSLGVPIQIVNYASLFRFKFQGNMDWLFISLNEKGIYIWEGRNMFISTAHTDADIREFVDKTKEAVNELINIGYIKANRKVEIKPKEKVISKHKFIDAHHRFAKLIQQNQVGEQAGVIALAMELEGDFNFKALKSAVSETLNRHEVFGSRFFVEDGVMELGHENTCQVQEIDFRDLENSSSHLYEWMLENVKEPFNLKEETALRLHVLHTEKEKATLSLVCHHLLMDGLSIAFLIDELSKRYTMHSGGKRQKLMDAIPFSEFVSDYEANKEKVSEQKQFWLEQYSEPYTRIEKLESQDLQANRLHKTIEKEQYKKIRMFGYKHKSSLLQTMLSYFSFYMRNYLKVNDLCVGIPTAGHQSIKKSMVGNCVNIIPLRLKISNHENPSLLIPEIKELQLEAFRNCEYPSTVLKEELNIDPIQISFNIEPVDELPKFGNLKAKIKTYPITACEFALSFNIMKVEDNLEIEMDYQSGLFTSSEAESFLDGYLELLKSIS